MLGRVTRSQARLPASLGRRRWGFGSEFAQTVTMAPPPVLFFDLSKFLPLFVGKIDRDILVRFRHGLMDSPAGIAPYLVKLRSRFIDNWRNFRDLFRCQPKLRAKPLFHSVAHSPWTVKLKEKVPSVKSPQSSARDSASDENEDKSSNEFPF